MSRSFVGADAKWNRNVSRVWPISSLMLREAVLRKLALGLPAVPLKFRCFLHGPERIHKPHMTDRVAATHDLVL